MEEAVRKLLLDAATVKALVANRVDWVIRSQGATLPAITIHLITGTPQMHYSGPSGWSRDRLQFDCWGRTHKDARDVADTLAGRGGLLLRFRGDLPGLRLRTFVINRRSDEERDSVGPVHRALVEVLAWHTPLPTE